MIIDKNDTYDIRIFTFNAILKYLSLVFGVLVRKKTPTPSYMHLYNQLLY